MNNLPYVIVEQTYSKHIFQLCYSYAKYSLQTKLYNIKMLVGKWFSWYQVLDDSANQYYLSGFVRKTRGVGAFQIITTINIINDNIDIFYVFQHVIWVFEKRWEITSVFIVDRQSDETEGWVFKSISIKRVCALNVLLVPISFFFLIWKMILTVNRPLYYE